MKDEHLASSHHGKNPLCVPGTVGAELCPAFTSLKHDDDIVITKEYYSAFTHTELDTHLHNAGITNIAIAGVSASHCVLATAIDAFLNALDVLVLFRCVGACSSSAHAKAMEKIAKYYGRVVDDVAALPPLSAPLSLSSELKAKGERVLYYVNGSIPSWRVIMMLSELNVTYTPIRLKVMSTPKETRSLSFSRINPRCKTPTLIDEGVTVIESMAILQYLEKKYGKDGATKEDGWVRTLTRFHEADNTHYILEDIDLCFEDQLTTTEFDRAVKAVDNTLAEMRYWEAYVSECDYVDVVGDEFSIADCAFYPCVAYLKQRGWEFEGFPALARYVERVRRRRCAVEACPVGWGKRGKVNLWRRARDLAGRKEEG